MSGPPWGLRGQAWGLGKALMTGMKSSSCRISQVWRMALLWAEWCLPPAPPPPPNPWIEALILRTSDCYCRVWNQGLLKK